MTNDTVLHLRIIEGPLAGKRFALKGSEARLGRSEGCDIQLEDRLLSRKHCLFIRTGGHWKIVDMASVNGTYVNGERIDATSRIVTAGQRIAVGDSVLLVEGKEKRNPWKLDRRFLVAAGTLLAACLSIAVVSAIGVRRSVRRPVHAPLEADARSVEINVKAVDKPVKKIEHVQKLRQANRKPLQSPAVVVSAGDVKTAVSNVLEGATVRIEDNRSSPIAEQRQEIAPPVVEAKTSATPRSTKAAGRKAFLADTEIEISSGCAPIRGQLVKASNRLVTLQIRPGVEYSIPRERIRKMIALGK